MHEHPRKTLIPSFTLTELCAANDSGAIKRSIKTAVAEENFTYYIKPAADPITGVNGNYNLFPMILDKDSIPWELGMLFILHRLEGYIDPDMSTIKGLADDLGVYKEWLDTHENPDELLIDFPRMKLRRVTYRYRAAIKKKCEVGELAVSTGNRRMGVVIAFYRWMMASNLFEPANAPWEERHYDLAVKNSYGKVMKKAVVSTDLAFNVSKADDPLEGVIQDDGKLKPLTSNEQEWVMDSLYALGNGEMYLLLLFMLLTGARIQTACTLRLRHFLNPNPAFSRSLAGNEKIFKLKAGPGTGVDTKRDKSGILQIPKSLYDALHIYAVSERTQKRREMAEGGDQADQYLFLTQQGSPYYTSKEASRRFNPNIVRRHKKNGGTIRQFLKDKLLPYIRKNYSSNFHFRIHDLRASFGMNQTDVQMALVEAGVISLRKARTNVMELMWHSSSEITERYLDYRKQREMIYAAINGYGDQVQKWIKMGTDGKTSN